MVETSEPVTDLRLTVWIVVWADNADVVSKAYSGTGALKTDYTRSVFRSHLISSRGATNWTEPLTRALFVFSGLERDRRRELSRTDTTPQ